MIDKNIVAFVNARKGSKGIPGKNKKKLLGKPLIEWTLDVIKNCKYISKVIVSTDDEDVFNICENYGCKPPFLRPSNLGGDNVLQIDVIKHSVNYLKSINYNFENIILLQPTCPIRIVNDLNMSIEKYCHNNYDSLISVTDVGGRHPKTCYSSIDNKLNPLMNSSESGVLRQEFEKVYWRNGSIYIFNKKNIIENNSLYGKSIGFYEMPEERSFNLDSTFDWDITESYLSFKK
jgi:CMP-N,N'-diacetyllegionaminic acid synthase